jgi:uncharacterized protein
MARTVACPICGKDSVFSPENEFRPFCSKRCRLTDLGAWANEEYAIPDAKPANPEDENPDEPIRH